MAAVANMSVTDRMDKMAAHIEPLRLLNGGVMIFDQEISGHADKHPSAGGN